MGSCVWVCLQTTTRRFLQFLLVWFSSRSTAPVLFICSAYSLLPLQTRPVSSLAFSLKLVSCCSLTFCQPHPVPRPFYTAPQSNCGICACVVSKKMLNRFFRNAFSIQTRKSVFLIRLVQVRVGCPLDALIFPKLFGQPGFYSRLTSGSCRSDSVDFVINNPSTKLFCEKTFIWTWNKFKGVGQGHLFDRGAFVFGASIRFYSTSKTWPMYTSVFSSFKFVLF